MDGRRPRGANPKMRRLDSYVKVYGPLAGPRLYHLLQSQAAQAGACARLRRKLNGLTGPWPTARRDEPPLPLFPEPTLATAQEQRA